MNTRQLRALTTITWITGASAVLLAGVCVYQWWTIGTVARQADSQRLHATVEKRQIAEQRDLQAQQRTLAQRVASRRSNWSWSDQLPMMVGQVTRLVASQGARVDSLQPEPVVTRQQLVRFPLRVTLRLPLDRLTGVLAQMRQAKPLLAIDHLTVRTGEYADDPLSVDLTLSSYVMLEGIPKGGKK